MTQNVSINLGDTQYFRIVTSPLSLPKDEIYWGTETNWVTPPDLKTSDKYALIYETRKSLSSDGLKKINNRVQEKESIVICTVGVGIARVGLLKNRAAVSKYLITVDIKDKTVLLPEYVALMISSSRDQIMHFAKGNVTKYLSRETIERVTLPVISLDEQLIIVNKSQN